MTEDLVRIEAMTAEIALEFRRLNANPDALVRWGDAADVFELLGHVRATATEMYLAWCE